VITTKQIARNLRDAVNEATLWLNSISDEESGRPLAEGKWSRKEIIGHLTDSASNNHQRFVRAQLAEHYESARYTQNEWVSLQHYRDAEWRSLITLWREFNLHLARVIESTPDDVAARHRIQLVNSDEAQSLGWWMNDYVGHLRHHLGQIVS
jgi:hypothetical protein